ncbi:hypothetical protein OJAV_G00057200 [Oryzias javanicus]|uniref:Uncharacterized protein n=1 Tax=Oryzias javanicus TaxID=123683 RepID=A0A437DAP8_ORYJA|nr:hypothetical protein OJAV_G00057200 [Oryzias javanicus]
MALQLRVSWLFMLMCVCFLPQDGYRHVHGRYLFGGPLTSDQFNPGKFLEANFENNLEYLRQLYKNGNNARPVRSLMEEVQPGLPGSVQKRDKPLVFQKEMSNNGAWRRRGAGCRDECPSFDPVRSIKSRISTRENQEFSPTPQKQVAVRPDSSGKENGGLSRGNRETLRFSNKQFFQSNYKPPGHTLLSLDSSSGKDFFSGRRVVSAPNTPKSLSQNYNHLSRKKMPSLPLNGNGNVLKSKYRSNRKYLSKRYKTPSAGFDKGLQRGIQTGPPPQKPQFLSSYVPRSQPNVKHLKKPAPLFQSFQSNASKRAKSVHHPSMLNQGVSSGFVVISNNRFPQNTRGDITVQYKPAKLLDNPHLVMKVPNSRHSSTTECKYLDYQKVDARTPLKDDIKLDLNGQKLVADLQESNTSVTKPREANLKQRVMPSNLSENQLKSFSAQDRFLLVNGGYEDALKAGLLKPLSQPDFPILSSMLNEDPAKLEPWPSLLLPEPPASNCVVWKDTQRSPPQKSQRLSQPSENAYLASKNRSARATASVSKICFTPNKLSCFHLQFKLWYCLLVIVKT